MVKIKISSLLRKGKSLILAYDQGIEHGPTDFNLNNIDPGFILKIGEKGGYNGIVLQHGIAEKYYDKKKYKIPLIVKLNGKTRLSNNDPISLQICSVKRAVKLGAVAVGYTVYPGSEFESQMFKECGAIVEEAHKIGIPVILWVYPRGKSVTSEYATETIAYAARIGLELGADFIKIQYNGDFEGFKWIVKAAGKAKVLVAGGFKVPDNELMTKVYEIINAGAHGIAIGRNVWQHSEPLKITRALKKIIFEKKSPEEALRVLNKR